MRLRYSATVAGLAASALVLAACGGEGEGEYGGSEAPGTVSFYTDKAAWEPQFLQVSDVSEHSLGLGLEFTGYSDAEQYNAFIKQSFRTDEKPELFTWHTGSQLEELVAEDLVAPTTDIWQQAIDDGNVPAELRKNFTVGEEQYCVPMNAAYWVMYYNKKIFAEHGIKEPKTWDQLMNAADTLVAAGETPFYETNILFSFVWFQTLLAGTDPELYQALSTGEASYTDQGVVDVMNRWRKMLDAGYFGDPGDQTPPQEQLKAGTVSMINFGTFLSGQLNSVDMVAGEDYGFFTIPNVNPDLGKQSLIFETSPICTAKDAENKDTALQYASWWFTEEAQTAWANARGDVSFNPKALINDEELATLNEEAGTDGYQLLERYFEATPQPILTVALDEFSAFVTNPGDPMPHLETIQAEAEAYWSEQG
ncbi:multiple sugar transport system substrate-binding protein [Haloactinopolyspora alba]|uniref:Multiple sugar transport system substrate-binding protein n=1 Tax=Haloactinopolyspora alba TaxID=648780 RepID=A0A2P8DXD1_9ACTN|nr:extracellular solute-binding protein [Haloactinopolyspora alba]PSL01874.1 multiple sugar transport system substrate-binding protein [Haloactinopolyspora alba]